MKVQKMDEATRAKYEETLGIIMRGIGEFPGARLLPGFEDYAWPRQADGELTGEFDIFIEGAIPVVTSVKLGAGQGEIDHEFSYFRGRENSPVTILRKIADILRERYGADAPKEWCDIPEFFAKEFGEVMQ